MPGFNTLPAVGGGGGQANMTFVASIHMPTYNRSWAQGGTPGYYALYSTNQENGYAYFVGATTTGVALNKLANITHSFTRIDIIAPQNDMISLYKGKVKSTTEFPNPFAAFSSFPSVISSSGNFVLPNNALPLVNILINGAGGGGGNNRGGGGGGGGVVKLTAFQAVGTTSITIGGGGGHGTRGSVGGSTYFGNVYAKGGSGGAHHGHKGGGPGSDHGNQDGVNGGGAGGHDAGHAGGPGLLQVASTGLGNSGSPVSVGGFSGGSQNVGGGANGSGGGGGGAGGNGQDGGNSSGGRGGSAHWDDTFISSNLYSFGSGGHGSSYNQHYNDYGTHNGSQRGHGGPGGHHNHNGGGGAGGSVVVRYYIP
jgi:hypothetical protein